MIEALSSYQQRNNQQLDQWLNRIPFQTLPLIEAMRYGLLLGGKRHGHIWCTSRANARL